MALSREAILAAKDVETREVHVPEWADGSGDDVVLVKGLTGRGRDAFEASLQAVRAGKVVGQDVSNLRAKLVAQACVDESGALLFSPSDVAALGEKSGKALDRLFDEIMSLSGMTPDAEAEVAGNSEAAPSGGSTSD